MTLVHSSLMCVSLEPPTLKSRPPGSTLKEGRSLAVLLSVPLVHPEKTGRSFGTYYKPKRLGFLADCYSSALSEVVGAPLPYDDTLSLRDRMWDISPTLIRYDQTERTSAELALAGLAEITSRTSGAKASGSPFLKPIRNFYQTDPISRSYVFSLDLVFLDH